MLRRFAIVVLLLSLPLRLWAGERLMTVLAVEPAVVAAAHTEHEAHPCHEASSPASAEAAPESSLQAHCGTGVCQVCAVCHMPALDAAGALGLSQTTPRDWVPLSGLSSQSASVDPLFKPPVSFV